MKTVSVQDLKQHLSEFLSSAEAGEKIVVTRHNRPIVTLSSSEMQHVQVGKNFGKTSLRPAVKKGTGGRGLEILLEDRYGDER